MRLQCRKLCAECALRGRRLLLMLRRRRGRLVVSLLRLLRRRCALLSRLTAQNLHQLRELLALAARELRRQLLKQRRWSRLCLLTRGGRRVRLLLLRGIVLIPTRATAGRGVLPGCERDAHFSRPRGALEGVNRGETMKELGGSESSREVVVRGTDLTLRSALAAQCTEELRVLLQVNTARRLRLLRRHAAGCARRILLRALLRAPRHARRDQLRAARLKGHHSAAASFIDRRTLGAVRERWPRSDSSSTS